MSARLLPLIVAGVLSAWASAQADTVILLADPTRPPNAVRSALTGKASTSSVVSCAVAPTKTTNGESASITSAAGVRRTVTVTALNRPPASATMTPVPSPTAVTVPTISWPGTIGYRLIPQSLRAMCKSEWQIPLWVMRMATAS